MKRITDCPITRDKINIKQDFQDIYAQYKYFSNQEWRDGITAAKHYFDIVNRLLDDCVDRDGIEDTIDMLIEFGLSDEEIADLNFEIDEVAEYRANKHE